MNISELTDFLFELDKLKLVERKTYVHGGVRRENSAEHSWQLALACWAFATELGKALDMEKLLKLALIHDLGEIDGGDTFLYAPDRASASDRERQCVQRLSTKAGTAFNELSKLWEEQELGLSEEARLLKVVDRLLPFMHNMKSEGKAWRENGISRAQVEQAHHFISDLEPDIHRWFLHNIDQASSLGWLIDTAGSTPTDV